MILMLASCAPRPDANANRSAQPAPQTQPTPTAQSTPEVKTYQGVGVVTDIVLENEMGNPPSVGLDHEEIEGLMPPMKMTFYVKEKSILNGLKVGDPVEFTIEEKGGTEVISKISKRK